MDSLITHDRHFFDYLTAGNVSALDRLLAADFLLVAIDSGAVVSKGQLLDAIGSGTLKFGEIESFPKEAVIRRVADVGIVVGRTTMAFNEDVTASRYTHVFRTTPDGWQLLSAQGTKIQL